MVEAIEPRGQQKKHASRSRVPISRPDLAGRAARCRAACRAEWDRGDRGRPRLRRARRSPRGSRSAPLGWVPRGPQGGTRSAARGEAPSSCRSRQRQASAAAMRRTNPKARGAARARVAHEPCACCQAPREGLLRRSSRGARRPPRRAPTAPTTRPARHGQRATQRRPDRTRQHASSIRCCCCSTVARDRGATSPSSSMICLSLASARCFQLLMVETGTPRERAAA